MLQAISLSGMRASCLFFALCSRSVGVLPPWPRNPSKNDMIFLRKFVMRHWAFYEDEADNLILLGAFLIAAMISSLLHILF